jgi:protein farnesyltransferase subunit beta
MNVFSLNRAADAYHTLYCLSGLSSAQHHVFPSPARRTEIQSAWKSNEGTLNVPYYCRQHMPDTSADTLLDSLRKSAFSEALSWIEEEGTSKILGGPDNRVVSSLLG